MIIRKKRAHRNNEELHCDNATTSSTVYTKPMLHIALSSDEKSHCSSVSSSSTIDESYWTEDEEEDEDDEDGGGNKSAAKERALNAFNGVKGGARKLGTKGKSALGGWKGTGKKFSSALFM